MQEQLSCNLFFLVEHISVPNLFWIKNRSHAEKDGLFFDSEAAPPSCFSSPFHGFGLAKRKKGKKTNTELHLTESDLPEVIVKFL